MTLPRHGEGLRAATQRPNPADLNRRRQHSGAFGYAHVSGSGLSSRLRVVVAEHVFPAEPGRITSTVVVWHHECGRAHVHRVRNVNEVTEVWRRPLCGGRKYLVVLPAPVALPQPRLALEAVGT